MKSAPASPARARNPRGEGEKLRAALIDAARELLVEVGDQDKLSVRAVTARAGVSPNALYLHFAGKEELLSAVMISSFEELRAALRGAVSCESEPLGQLRALGLAYCTFAEQRPGIYRVLFMTRIRDGVPIPAPDGEVGLDEGVDAFEDLRAVVAQCVPAQADPFERAADLWAGLHGYVSLKAVLGKFPWPDPSDYVERMIALHIQPGPQMAQSTI